MSRGHKDLEVWKKGKTLYFKIFEITKKFPIDERFELSSQMRKSSLSIIANIAEGWGRNSLNEYIHFVGIAIGSSNELELYIEVSKNHEYINQSEFDELDYLHRRVSKMLFNLRLALQNKKSSSS